MSESIGLWYTPPVNREPVSQYFDEELQAVVNVFPPPTMAPLRPHRVKFIRGLTERRVKTDAESILTLIRSMGPCYIADIRRDCHMGMRAARQAIETLIEKGVLMELRQMKDSGHIDCRYDLVK